MSQLAVPSRTALQALPAEQREREEQGRVIRQKILMRAVAELALVELTRLDKGKEKATAGGADASMTGPACPGGEWLYMALRDMVSCMIFYWMK
jgi:regulator of nonsense transcripts 2